MSRKKEKQAKAEWEDQGVKPSHQLPEFDDYDPTDDGQCFMCGGSGELDECECSQFEDTCCCLNPVPLACPECARRDK